MSQCQFQHIYSPTPGVSITNISYHYLVQEKLIIIEDSNQSFSKPKISKVDLLKQKIHMFLFPCLNITYFLTI